MLVYKNYRCNLRTGAAVCELEEYEGPVVHAGGGGTDVTNQTVPTGPFEPQIPFIMQLFQEANRLYQENPTQFYPGQAQTGQPGAEGRLTAPVNTNITTPQQQIGDVAGGNVDQNQAIQQILQQLGGGGGAGIDLGQSLVPGIQGGIDAQLNAGDNALSQFAGGQADPAAGAYSTIFGQDPSQIQVPGTQGGGTDAGAAVQQLLQGGGGQNPYLDQLVQSAIQSQTDAFNRSVLPGIRSEAGAAGQPGGTRQGIAEGIAAGDLTNSIGNTVGSIYGNAFNTQAGLQGQAVQNVFGAQQADQQAGLQGQSLQQQIIQNLLQGTGQVGSLIGQGAGLGLNAIGTGTAQGADLFQGGNTLELQQIMGALGLIPSYQASSLGQMGAQSNLGLQQYGLQQNQLDALMNEFFYNQGAPFQDLNQYQQSVTGPYGSTVGPYQGPSPSAGPTRATPAAQPAPPITDPRQPQRNVPQPAGVYGQPGQPNQQLQ